MRLFVPSIGDLLELTADWTFDLYNERRNTSAFEHLFERKMLELKAPATLQKGTTLQIDRLYIRKGKGDFSSITFTSWIKEKRTKIRFWAKLEDCNRIEYTLVLQPPVVHLTWSHWPQCFWKSGEILQWHDPIMSVEQKKEIAWASTDNEKVVSVKISEGTLEQTEKSVPGFFSGKPVEKQPHFKTKNLLMTAFDLRANSIICTGKTKEQIKTRVKRYFARSVKNNSIQTTLSL